MPSPQATFASPPASLTSPSLLFFHPVSPFCLLCRALGSATSPIPATHSPAGSSAPFTLHQSTHSSPVCLGPWVPPADCKTTASNNYHRFSPTPCHSATFYVSSGFTSIYVILWISLTPSNKNSWWAPDWHRQSANLVAKGNPALSWEHKDGCMVLHTGKICQTYPTLLQPVSPLLCALGHSSRLGFWQEQNAAVFWSLCPLMSARTIWKNNDI